VRLDNTVEVETPEQVCFRFRVAGPARRAWAYLIDLLVRAIALLVVELLLLLATGRHVGSSEALLSSGTLLILFVMEWGYFVVFETAWNGTTPGKRALRLRVVKEGGYPLTFMDSMLRNLLRTADFLPVGYLLGVLVMTWDGRFARLGDRAAGTMVVIEDPVKAAPPISLEPPPSAAELEAFPLRLVLPLPEREAIELLLRRRDLSSARRVELAEMLAPTLQRRLGVTVDDPVRFLALVYHRAVGGAGAGYPASSSSRSSSRARP
jgi:uncharacterized RDD family membrane protein YckC